MFSYQHVFHAGNHADVLKHVVLMEVLQYVCQKDVPVYYIDTHAGAGMYTLTQKEARKNREFESGIARLWHQENLPPELKAYCRFIRDLNPDGRLRHYPGSPYFAERLLRNQDRLRFFEWHPAENQALTALFTEMSPSKGVFPENTSRRGKRIMIEKRDGFAALKGQLPPPSRRAVVLMDPSYENKSDYQSVMSTLKEALKRFASGVYLVWYPVLSRLEAKRFPDQLKKLPVKEWINVTLTVRRASPDGLGLYGSGLYLINPPWKLQAFLENLMPHLTALLGQDTEATYQIQTSSGMDFGR